ncbi:D-Ala-D-Ala carboxypeptidase family metallohydrolase [Yimella radicis]
MVLHRLTRLAAATAVATTAALGVGLSASGSASAAGCDSWSSTLKVGSRGGAVTELQIRVAGWVKSGTVMATDGVYGEQTKAAVARFQKAYGLTADGVAGSNTFAKLRSLTDPDCTPVHFSYAEASNNCGKGFTGGASEKANLRRALWQAEALRKQLGSHPLNVTSGYRDKACNASVDGASSSRHLTGQAIDLAPLSGNTMCGIARGARSAGFGGIFGPGYPGHSNHVHVDTRSYIRWSASQCF